MPTGTKSKVTGFFKSVGRGTDFSLALSSLQGCSCQPCVFLLACNVGYGAVKAAVLTCTPHGMSTPAAVSSGTFRSSQQTGRFLLRRSVSISCNYRSNTAQLKGVNHLRRAGSCEVCRLRVEANLPCIWSREQISICYRER